MAWITGQVVIRYSLDVRLYGADLSNNVTFMSPSR